MGRQNCQESVDLKNALLWLLFQHTGSKKEAYNVDHSSWNQETPINCLFHWHPWHTWSSLWQQPLTALGEENTENREIIYLYPYKNKGWFDIYSYKLCPPQSTNPSPPTPPELIVITAVTEKKLQTCPSGAAIFPFFVEIYNDLYIRGREGWYVHTDQDNSDPLLSAAMLTSLILLKRVFRNLEIHKVQNWLRMCHLRIIFLWSLEMVRNCFQ